MRDVPAENYLFSSYFIYVTAVISLLVFDFKNSHLTAFSIIMMPTELFTTGYLQYLNFNFYFTLEWDFIQLLDASIDNFAIHALPFLIGLYAIKTREGGLINWNLFRDVIMIYFLWCYFLDFRFTAPEFSRDFQWYMFGFLIWSTIFAYFYIRKINKIELFT